MEYQKIEQTRRGEMEVGTGKLQSLSDILKKPNFYKEFAKHPYFKLLDTFYNRVNAEQVRAGYRKISYGEFAKRLSVFKLDSEKWAFLKQCQQSKDFGRLFFGVTKKKMIEQGMMKPKKKPKED